MGFLLVEAWQGRAAGGDARAMLTGPLPNPCSHPEALPWLQTSEVEVVPHWERGYGWQPPGTGAAGGKLLHPQPEPLLAAPQGGRSRMGPCCGCTGGFNGEKCPSAERLCPAGHRLLLFCGAGAAVGHGRALKPRARMSVEWCPALIGKGTTGRSFCERHQVVGTASSLGDTACGAR